MVWVPGLMPGRYTIAQVLRNFLAYSPDPMAYRTLCLALVFSKQPGLDRVLAQLCDADANVNNQRLSTGCLSSGSGAVAPSGAVRVAAGFSTHIKEGRTL